MTKRSYLYGGTAMAVTLSLFAIQARAADAAAAPAGGGATTADAATTISELIVTAEKREQRLQDVPVAISAFSAEQRTLVGISSVQDLTNFTPGLHFQAAADRPYLRGIGRNTDNLAVASAVATYYDGVYYGANATILLQHSDLFVDTIEVDRGPQNSLHGANADGGTINYISKRPTKDFYAEGRAGVANNQRYWGEAAVSGPITDWLRFRLGGNYTSERGGFFKNLGSAKDAGGSLPQETAGESQYIEGQLDANIDKLDAWAKVSSGTFSADYHQVTRFGNFPDNYQANGSFSPNTFFGLCGLPGVATSPGGASGCTGPGALGQTVVPGSVVGGPVFANAFPGNNPANLNNRDFIENYNATNKERANFQFATNVTYHFGPADLTYLGGYQKFNYVLNFIPTYTDSGINAFQLAGPTTPSPTCLFLAGNTGANPAGCTQPLTVFPIPNTTFFQENDHFYSHELNLISTTQGPFQWILGAYYYHEQYDQPVWAGVMPAQTQLAHPVTTSLTPAPANPASAISTSDTRLEYNSWALFGHVDYKITDEFKAHASLRYTHDHKFGEQFWRFEEFAVLGGLRPSNLGALTPAVDVTSAATAASLGVTFPGAGPARINPVTGNAERNLDESWSEWTGDAGIDWTPDSSTLVYAKYSRGYKAGGFSTFTLAANPETGKETVDSYEAGVKKTFANVFQVNGAAFFYNYKNDQIPLNVQTNGLIASQLFNLKSVHISGVELEAIWRPTDQLTFSGQYAHLSAKVNDPGACFEDVVDPAAALPGANTSGCTAASLSATGALVPATQNLKGQTLPEAPPNKVSLTGIYTLNFDPGKLALSGSYIWKDKTFGTLFNRQYSEAPELNQVNLRAIWTSANDNWNLIAYVDNVLDRTNRDSRSGSLLQAPTAPGQVGVLSINDALVNPRTYGLEFRIRFH
jgi:iron complex outermembrane receptor protein